MDFVITFLEGVATFVSPCLLPMLPVYLAYFAGTGVRGADKPAGRGPLAGALGFIVGFALVFCALGAFAGTVGALLAAHRRAVELVCGAVVIVFGLHIAGLVRIPALDRALKPVESAAPRAGGFAPAVLFGIVFAIGWTPCVGVYLGSALLLASTSASAARGVALLLTYSLGLGLPFAIAALLVDRLAGAFDAVKRHYRAVELVCGVLLVAVGVLMATGLFGTWLGALSLRA